MLKEMLKDRGVPALKPRDEMLETLLREEYGYLPPKPDNVTFELLEKPKYTFCAGKAVYYIMKVTSVIGEKEFSFPLHCVIPNKEGKFPFFVHVNFRPDVPDRYMSSEEIVDNGFAVLSFCYQDITSDDGDFTNGLAGVLYPDGKRGPTDAGKIAMWAWATHRAMDYAETLDCLDKEVSIVCGHSRLGKTALLAGATDSRFKFAHSNDSGCSGAAITRGKRGERVENICTKFPFWFCENYYKYMGNENEMPFDQHWLISCIAPRYVSVASAVEDVWADPESELLSCFATGDCVCPDRLPEVDDMFFDGRVGYFLRAGKHYFSREDWNKLIMFINKKV